MEQLENGMVGATYQGTIQSPKGHKINWKSITISKKPGISLTFTESRKGANYAIEPAPAADARASFYEKLAKAAMEKAKLDDPNMMLPPSIMNLLVNSVSYTLRKG